MIAEWWEIEDAWITDINASVKQLLGLKTVTTFEGNFDAETLQSQVHLAPFVLLQCINDEAKTYSGDLKTLQSEQTFGMIIGADTLRAKRAGQIGCYQIISTLKNTYGGKTLTIKPAKYVQLKYIRTTFVLSVTGLLIYQSIYSISKN